MKDYQEDEKLVIEGFDPNFTEIFKKFLSCYKNNKGNINNYRNAFTRLLEHVNKSNISTWSLEDYKSILNEKSIPPTKQIFKFLFAYDYLDDVEGFTSEFGNKELILTKIEKKADKTKAEYKSALSLKELVRIISFVNSVASDDFENIRIALSFYLLFDLCIPVQSVKSFRAENYNKGFYVFIDADGDIEDGDIIEIPEKFDLFLENLKQKSQTGLSTPNINITDLGERVGIANLTPKAIIDAKKQRILRCSECGIELLSSLDNWVSINGYLVCKDCGEQLVSEQDVKKNEIVDNILSFTLDFTDNTKDLDNNSDFDDEQPTQDDEGFSEGKQNLKKHLVRERDKTLVKNAKAKFIKLNGALYCEVCNFSFAKVYGMLGEDFIEAHHIKPVSEMGEDEKTQMNDILMVCSNCHSMLHRKKPWLSRKEDLKQILLLNSK